MADRVAVLGLLNKRNGIVRDITLKPGQAVRIRDAVVRLRACESTAPWENEKLTGAFVQLDVEQPGGGWKRAFSGWLYKESPSLNVVEHPIYDVWPKSCAMSWPAGPDAPASPADSSNRSSAPKSAGASSSRRSATAAPDAANPTPERAPEPEPAPTADPRNAT
jgi:pyruvate/2-oxoglutarate dehydrogenase complex dihydrolipoamide acyltransferase (E2) component